MPGTDSTGKLVDIDRLSIFFRTLGIDDVQSINRFPGGQSNPTFRISTTTADYVLRRKPSGALLKGAHAVEREARVQRALYDVGFPVPRIIVQCDDETVIGSPFYLMELVDGRLFWNATFRAAPLEQRAALFDAMNATLARLHTIDPASVGLKNFGRSENYLARQIARWTQQYRDDQDAGRLPELDVLADWLPTVIPDDAEASIVHGDFRVDNMIFAPAEPEVLAVIDWELSTIGHPLADFAYHLMMYHLPPSFPGGIFGEDLEGSGLPSETEYLGRYCERTGRTGAPNLDIYLCYNLFRFAAIIHGIKGRAARGNASSGEADTLVTQLPVIAKIAHDRAMRAGAPAVGRPT